MADEAQSDKDTEAEDEATPRFAEAKALIRQWQIEDRHYESWLIGRLYRLWSEECRLAPTADPKLDAATPLP